MQVSYEPTICDKLDAVILKARMGKRKILRITLTRPERHEMYVHSGGRFTRANRTMMNFYGSQYRGVYIAAGTTVHVFAQEQ